MKLIVAVIRADRLNEVLEALFRAEVRGITVSRVDGHGGELTTVETYRGAMLFFVLPLTAVTLGVIALRDRRNSRA